MVVSRPASAHLTDTDYLSATVRMVLLRVTIRTYIYTHCGIFAFFFFLRMQCGIFATDAFKGN